MKSFLPNFHAVIFGAGGGIGAAMASRLTELPSCTHLTLMGRNISKIEENVNAIGDTDIQMLQADICDEDSIASVATQLGEHINDDTPFQLFVNASGILHDEENDLQPERSIRHLSNEAFQKVFAINSFGPALLIKHFLPFMPRDQRSVFASLSARVGSISDNKIGGWYAYRASKAAHNMLIKTASLEARMKYKQAVIVGLHPGTVATNLSAPFRGNVSPEKLFSPSKSADYLLDVMDNLTPAQSGAVFAWDGQEIPA